MSRVLIFLVPLALLFAGCTSILDLGAKSGDLAPAFDLVDLEGVPLNLSTFAGRVLVLDFMSSTCGPCRVQMPHLLELNASRPDIAIISVSVDPSESNATLAAFRDEFEAEWPFAKGPYFGIREDYGVLTLPKTVVIDGEGRISFSSKPGEAISRDALFDAVASARGGA